MQQAMLFSTEVRLRLAAQDLIACRINLEDARIVRDDLILSLYDSKGWGATQVAQVAGVNAQYVRDTVKRLRGDGE